MSHFLHFGPLICIILLTLPAWAQEQPPPAPPISAEVNTEPETGLDDLIRRAFENNPRLLAAREGFLAAQHRLRAARAQAGPTLQVVPGLGNREARDEEIILSQPLDLFGRRGARATVASAEVRGARARSTLAERTLVVEVKNAAAGLFAAQEAESLGQTQVEVARLFRDAAARRAELGDVPPVQVQRAELELLRTQNELTNAQAERLVRRAVLNQLVGQAPETPLRVAMPTGSQPSLTGSGGSISDRHGGDLTSLRAQLLPKLSARPDIMEAQATIEARRAQAQVLRLERSPEVALQVRRSSVTGSGATALRAVITIPLFGDGSNRSERRALEAEARADEAQIVLLQSQAAMQVEQALIRLQHQQQSVLRYHTGIVPLTIELLRKTQIGYAGGASTYLEVLEAQRTLRQVQTEYLQALAAVRTTQAGLEGALGAELPHSLVGELQNPTGPSTPPGVAAPGTVPDGTIPTPEVAREATNP